MSATSHAEPTASSEQNKGVYVYGILPADIEMAAEVSGVGDPPGQVRVIRGNDLAALVSEVDVSRPLGSPEDFAAHKDILDASAADVPVLPLRFGAVLASEEAVVEELLEAHHDDFAAALDELEGRIEYVVKGRYVEQAVLKEILSENPEAASLRDQIRGQDADATRDLRIRLGEIMNEVISAKREGDTRVLGEAMADHCVASVVRDPTHEWDAVHVAFLVETDAQDEVERVIDDLAHDWEGRVELRLLGPMAVYDFIGTAEAGG